MAKYISAERLIADFSTYGCHCVYGSGKIKAIISRINLQPAADVEPVKRGKWIIENFEPDRVDVNYYRVLIRCSQCGITHFLGTTEHKNSFTKDELKLFPAYSYCGKCGAKMEGVAK